MVIGSFVNIRLRNIEVIGYLLIFCSRVRINTTVLSCMSHIQHSTPNPNVTRFLKIFPSFEKIIFTFTLRKPEGRNLAGQVCLNLSFK